MTPTIQCFISISNAKCDAMPFGEWLATPMGQIGLELTDNDVARLHAIYAGAEGLRLH